MLKRHFWKIVIAVVIILIGASVVYSRQASEKANEGVTTPEVHVKGNPDAEVVLVEYSDFQCPACGQFYPYVKEIMEEHGDSLRFEYRHFPLLNIHPQAVPAAIAAEAAGQQGKFFEMHDKLFEGQNTWSKSSNPNGYFEQYAEELGLDIGTFKRQLGSSVLEDAVMAQFDEARGRGFTGTPTFMLNGEVMDFDTFEQFEAMIEVAIGTRENN